MDSKLFNYAKSPIPILNNSSPHNYTIMSALLSHIDSPIASINSTESIYSNLCSSNQTFNSNYSKLTSRQYQNKNCFQNGMNSSNQQNNNRQLSSKEIIYTKRFKLQNLDINHNINNHVIHNNNQTNDDHIIIYTNENTSSNSNIQERVEEEVVNEPVNSNVITTHYETISNGLNLNKYVLEQEIDTNSLINTSTVIEQNSINTTNGTNYLTIQTDSFIDESNHNQSINQINTHNQQTEYSNLFTAAADSQSQNNDQTLIDNRSYQQNVSNSTNYNDQIESNDQSMVTYTISCPSDWQFNLNRMISCFISLNKNINFSSKTKLKCSVCKQEFNLLNDLADHKESNETCKNNINIQNMNSDRTKKLIKNRNFDTLNNYYIDEDFEEDDEDEINERQYELNDEEDDIDNLEDHMDNFYLDECEDELNELEEFDSSLNDDSNEIEQSNDKSKKYDHNQSDLFYFNNKLIAKVKLKNNVKFKLKNPNDVEKDFENTNEKSSKTINNNQNNNNNKPVKTRRKYTKNKTNTVPSLACEKCNKTCRTKAELLVHLHKHGGNGPECWECGKKCASFSNLVSHVQLHTGEKPYTCQFCGKQFTQDAHLTRHLRLHTGERPFVCNICGKNYKDYSYYKTHLRIHKGERLYKCNYCNKEYYDASYYKKHTRLHTGEKPYMCTVCGRQFHRSDYLKLHSYSHTDERPFNCHICGKGFKMNYNLKIHLKNHENQSSLINSSNDETCSFNDTNQFNSTSSSGEISVLNESYNGQSNLESNLNLNLNDSNKHTITAIVNTNDFTTNEIVSLFASNSIGLDANTIQIINNSANHHSSLNEIDSLLEEHQISIR